MKITKLGHCALILEAQGVKLLTDPGNYTIEAQESVRGLDAVVITHEHADHYHAESLPKILENNPDAVVVTNGAVAKLLKAIGIDSNVVGDGESTSVKGITIEGFGREHAPIYETMGLVENTGYRIADRFYFPGDNFHVPGKKIDVLALPVAGPWMKMSEAIDFAKAVNAPVAFGVHDAMMKSSWNFMERVMPLFVPGTKYVTLKDGESREF